LKKKNIYLQLRRAATMASAAVGETSNAAAAGNRRSCNQNNICSNGTISAAAVNKKSSLLLQADQQQKQLLAVQPGATAGSEKLNGAPGKSCSVNVDKNSMADRGNRRRDMQHYYYQKSKQHRPKLNKTYAHLIHDTIMELKARKGSSSNAIKKNIYKLHGSSLGPNYKKVVAYTLKKLTADGKLIRTGHSFKLAPTFRREFPDHTILQQSNPRLRQQAAASSQLQHLHAHQRKTNCIKKKVPDMTTKRRSSSRVVTGVAAITSSRHSGTPEKKRKPMLQCRRRSTTAKRDSRRQQLGYSFFNRKRLQKDVRKRKPLAAATGSRRRPRAWRSSRSTSTRSRLAAGSSKKRMKASYNFSKRKLSSSSPSLSTGSAGSKSVASALSAQSGISSK
jgi:hypothetical protein